MRQCRSSKPVKAVCVFIFLLYPAVSFGGKCGGSARCSCGDTVSEDYVMRSDLGPCLQHGLILESGVTLDCKGHVIRGSGNHSQHYGIRLGNGISDAIVKNCEVRGFRHGLRMKGAHKNRISHNNLRNNGDFHAHVGYGIAVHRGSNDNLFEENQVHNNADEGIHFGESHGNRVVGNRVYNNYRENIYLLRSNRGLFKQNTTWGGKSNSVYVKHSSANRFEKNMFRDRTARIRGDSQGNQFVGNNVVNTGIDFQFYVERGKTTRPRKNLVDGGTISGSKQCLSFVGASENAIRSVKFIDCQVEIASSSEGIAQVNEVIGIVLDPRKSTVEGNSRILVGWLVNVSVEDIDGTPVEAAKVRGFDANGRLVFEATTRRQGRIPTQKVIQFTQMESSRAIDTPHTLHIATDNTKTVRTVTIDENKDIVVKLGPDYK